LGSATDAGQLYVRHLTNDMLAKADVYEYDSVHVELHEPDQYKFQLGLTYTMNLKKNTLSLKSDNNNIR
jgi:hypothetical protein